MPSSLKTPNLKLNQFIAADKPKMDDFNYDNQKLDEQLGSHLADAQKHLSPADRTAILAGQVVTGTYVGNGAPAQAINLGFKAKAGVVFSPVLPCYRSDPNQLTVAQVFSGFFSDCGSTMGVDLTDTGIIVKMGGEQQPMVEQVALNMSNFTYVYMAWR